MKFLPFVKEMFQEMVVKKDASLIPHYYHPELLLYTNGQTIDYDAFLEMHEEYYATPIQYAIKYDEETLFEGENRMGGRIFITTSRPNEEPKELEVILIIAFKEGKIHRLWELTYPDWSKLDAFQQ